MRFKKYKHIDGVWQEKVVEYLRLKGFDDPSILWCVMEKAHGSNFAFYCDGNQVAGAKRTKILQPDESFYDWKRLIPKYYEKVQKMWENLEVWWSGDVLKELVVCGEMIGGNYPHPDVETLKRVKNIQKGVWYCPDIEFFCFDIMINEQFVDMRTVETLCGGSKIPYAEILFVGTFDECKDYSNKFPTKIPGYFGLPDIEGNICEGIVIKPLYPKFYADGDRVILKSKSEEFREKQKQPKKIRKEKNLQLSDENRKLLEELSKYITENRLINVLSKFGDITNKDYREVWQLFKDDVYDDFKRDFPDFVLYQGEEFRIIDKIVGKLCTDVWRPTFIRKI